MNKLFLTTFLVIGSLYSAKAQWTLSSPNTYFNLTGAVGIGTNNPGGKLHVIGTFISAVTNATGDNNNILIYNSNAASQTTDSRAGIWLDNDGRIKFRSTTGYGMAFRSQSNTFDILNITDNGLTIGTQTMPAGYSFAVNGKAIATSITVKNYANWPDYVFKKDYKLPTLADVKTYIDKNHHLPEIPSAQKIENDGLNLGEMNKLLMKKVEELTLYLIEKDQKISNQEQRMNALENKLNLLLQKKK